jgi:predicted small integral membrane protein
MAPTLPRWTALGSLTAVIVVFVALNSADLLLVAFGNITDFATNQAFVQHVLSMDTTNFGGTPGKDLDPNVMWHAITSPLLQNIGYVLIIAWETLAGLVLAVATVLLLRPSVDRRIAKALATIGLLMIVLLFMGGFIVVGGEWFQMWRSTAWNGEDAALRNVILASIPLILLHLPIRQRITAEVAKEPADAA